VPDIIKCSPAHRPGRNRSRLPCAPS
jgi:hypothetical protein